MSVDINTAVATKLVAVAPSNSTILACQALYIGVTGNVAIVADGDTAAVTLTNVPVGILPIACSKVMLTNTTATGIVALYV